MWPCDGRGRATGLQDVGKRILKERDGDVSLGKDRQKRSKRKDVSSDNQNLFLSYG